MTFEEREKCRLMASKFITFIEDVKDTMNVIENEELRSAMFDFYNQIDADLHDFVDGGFISIIERYEEDNNREKPYVGGEQDAPRTL